MNIERSFANELLKQIMPEVKKRITADTLNLTSFYKFNTIRSRTIEPEG